MTEAESEQPRAHQRRYETIAFVLLALVLFPFLSIVLVGGYGFVIWMQHILFGAPVH